MALLSLSQLATRSFNRITFYRYIQQAGNIHAYLELPYKAPVSGPRSRAARTLAAEEGPTGGGTDGSTLSHLSNISKPHLQEITAVTTFSTPYSPAMMIATADAAGVIKIWKVDI